MYSMGCGYNSVQTNYVKRFRGILMVWIVSVCKHTQNVALLLPSQQQPAEYAKATFVNKEENSVPNTVPDSCIPYIK